MSKRISELPNVDKMRMTDLIPIENADGKTKNVTGAQINTALNEYKVGDTINLTNCLFSGSFTGSQKDVYFWIPLRKGTNNINSLAVSGNWYIRHADGGYLVQNATLASLGTVTTHIAGEGVQIKLTLSNAASFTNN